MLWHWLEVGTGKPVAILESFGGDLDRKGVPEPRGICAYPKKGCGRVWNVRRNLRKYRNRKLSVTVSGCEAGRWPVRERLGHYISSLQFTHFSLIKFASSLYFRTNKNIERVGQDIQAGYGGFPNAREQAALRDMMRRRKVGILAARRANVPMLPGRGKSVGSIAAYPERGGRLGRKRESDLRERFREHPPRDTTGVRDTILRLAVSNAPARVPRS